MSGIDFLKWSTDEDVVMADLVAEQPAMLVPVRERFGEIAETFSRLDFSQTVRFSAPFTADIVFEEPIITFAQMGSSPTKITIPTITRKEQPPAPFQLGDEVRKKNLYTRFTPKENAYIDAKVRELGDKPSTWKTIAQELGRDDNSESGKLVRKHFKLLKSKPEHPMLISETDSAALLELIKKYQQFGKIPWAKLSKEDFNKKYTPYQLQSWYHSHQKAHKRKRDNDEAGPLKKKVRHQFTLEEDVYILKRFNEAKSKRGLFISIAKELEITEEYRSDQLAGTAVSTRYAYALKNK